MIARGEAASAQQSKKPDAGTIVRAAIGAVQGSSSLQELHSVRLDGVQHEFVLGNAERAEGPWRTLYTTFSELRDLDNARMRRTDRGVGPGIPPANAQPVDRVSILIDSVAGMKIGPRDIGGSPSSFETTIDRIDASPDRALKLAAASPALRWDRTVTHYGVVCDVVSFPWRNGRMKIEVSRSSHFPLAVDIVRSYPDDFRWGPFGDVTVRAEYMDWTVQPSGLWWPKQYAVFFNGEPIRNVTIGAIAINPVAPADSFAIPDVVRTQFAANAKQAFSQFSFGARGPVTELRPDILRVPDFWTMTMVRQNDGIVIFEAHISDKYIDEVIAEANRRYPGVPIKAFVMTSDPWAHLGGVRQVIARGIPIYVQSASIPFLTALAKTPHTITPDLLAKTPRTPRFVGVSGKTVIGTGKNQVVLYPVGGEYGERMLMAYFPQQKLLYGADLLFANRNAAGQPGHTFLETPAADLRSAIMRERLDVDALFSVQAQPLYDGAAFMTNELKPLVVR
jgi:hypothetical protein